MQGGQKDRYQEPANQSSDMPYDADIGHEEVENQVDHNEGLVGLAHLLEIGIVCPK